MSRRRISNVVGFDDAPFPPGHEGPVKVVGTVYAGEQLNGVSIGEVLKDGPDAAGRLADLVAQSRFAEHVQLVMLQGITLAGFNVVDVFELHDRLQLPVLVVARRRPDMSAVRRALLNHVPEGHRKWAVLERLGEMEPAGSVFIQHVGLEQRDAHALIRRFALYGHLPEPLRTAHLIAGALAEGQSRGGA